MFRECIEAVFVIAIFLMILAAADRVFGNDKVKYCRNAETGEIIVIQEGYPCPAPTHAI